MNKGKGKGKNSVVLPSGLFGLKVRAGVSQVDVDVKNGHFDVAPGERIEEPDVELDLQAVRGPDKRSDPYAKQEVMRTAAEPRNNDVQRRPVKGVGGSP